MDTRAILVAAIVTSLVGCQGPPGPIFPEISPPIVWPPPPDQPRIRYIGELHGEASLSVKPSGWEAVRAAIAGARPRAAFSRPSAVAVAGERVFVADTGLGIVHLLDLRDREYRVIEGAPSSPFQIPIDLTTKPDNELVVVDRGRAAIDTFDLNGRWRSTQRWDELSAPVAVAWDTSAMTLWLVDADAHACFATSDLRNLARRIGKRGSSPGEFNFPRAATAHPLVGLVVADGMNFRVQVFDRTGEATAVFGQKGDAAGDFAGPRDVAVDSEGHIYVLDNQFENVQVFDRHGRLLMAFGQGGQGPGEFSLPSGITIDELDRIWIADSYNRRVQVFQYLPEKASWAE